jgi:hypothetical protein
MTGATINTILGLILLGPAAGAAIGAHFARKHGYTQGYQRAYAEQELLVDDLRAENEHLEERIAQLSKQQRRAAA